jgi:hemolysin III
MTETLPAKILGDRSQSRAEETANAVTHGTGALLSVAALVVLIVRAAAVGDALTITGYAIFGASLILLFTMSTVYHSLTSMRAKKLFEIFDHCSIYVLIAGSYTAFCFTALRGPAGWTLFGLVWAIAACGIAFKALFIDRFRIVSTLGYLLMGWLIAPFFAQIRASMPPAALDLLIAGGLAYTIGAVIYMFKGLPWLHPVWHLFVLAGAAFHVFSALAMLGG